MLGTTRSGAGFATPSAWHDWQHFRARATMTSMVAKAREMQRRESSRLVVPTPGSMPPPGKGPFSLR